ncbi:MAG: T9SS type A sorting domain-containing protein [Fluviicola sp.]|nr:T9SS type A sorting domain-containing protein [Fluviicola sp.]
MNKIIFFLLCSLSANAQTNYYGSMTYNAGSIYRANEFGQPVELIHRFDTVNGSEPRGGMIMNGTRLYGRTMTGGFYNSGVLYYADVLTHEFSTVQHLPITFEDNFISSYSQELNGFVYNTGNLNNIRGRFYKTDFENGTITVLEDFQNYNVYFKPIINNGFAYIPASKTGSNPQNVIFKFDIQSEQLVDSLELDGLLFGEGSFQLIAKDSGSCFILNHFGGINDNGVISQLNFDSFTADTLFSFQDDKRHYIPGLVINDQLHFFRYSTVLNTYDFYRFNGSTIDSLFTITGSSTQTSRPSNGNVIGDRFVFSSDTICYSYNFQTQQLNLVGLYNSETYGIGAYMSSLINTEDYLSIETTFEQQYTLYPNPATSNIRFKGIKKTMNYTISNQLGKQVLTGTVNPLQPNLSIDILEAGSYLVQFENSPEKIAFVKL